MTVFRLRVALFVFSALPVCAAWSLDRDLEISQFVHRTWSLLDHAPDAVTSFAQTKHGHLWITSLENVHGFDGLEFDPKFPRIPFPSTNVTASFASVDGALWLGFKRGKIARLEGERLTTFGLGEGVPDGEVHGITEFPQGTMWAATRSGLLRFVNARWERVSRNLPPGAVYGTFVDAGNTLWIATRDGVFALDQDRNEFRSVLKFSREGATTVYFDQAPDGAVWVSAPGWGVARVDAASPSSRPWFADRPIGPIAFDREGSLWLGSDALLRLPPHALQSKNVTEAERLAQRFARVDGLSGTPVRAVFEDVEGNIWVATNSGIDRFNSSGIVRLPKPDDRSAWGPKAFAADRDGALWIATTDDPALFKYIDGKLVDRVEAPMFTAASQGPDGSVWFAGPRGIARVNDPRASSLKIIPLPAEAGSAEVQALVVDRDGDPWVSIDGQGIYQFARTGWKRSGGMDLPPETAVSAAATESGDLWFGYADSRVLKVDGSSIKQLSSNDGLKVGAVNALLPSGSSVWIAGDLGMAFFDGQRIHTLVSDNCGPFFGITGLVERSNGDLWMNRSFGLSVVRKARQQLAQGVTEHRLDCENFGSHFGVRGGAQQTRPLPSLLQTTEGRIWLASTHEVYWAWADRLEHRYSGVQSPTGMETPRAAITSLWALAPTEKSAAYEKGTRVRERPIRLAPRTRDIDIHFTALSVTAPTYTRFKWRLVGYDESWRSGGRRRDIMYTNLGPGQYRFEVASSYDGIVFDAVPAALEFEILPAFYQTRWFHVLCAILSGLLIAALIRFQIQRAGRRIRERLEERMRERERIARDLHDTLLQGVQALILRVHSASRQLARHEPARLQIEQALEFAESALVEGRDRVTHLRDAASEVRSLSQDILVFGKRLADEAGVDFVASVHGDVRELHPIVREEASLIAREALTNAIRHAHAKRIIVRVHYDRAALRIDVDDDGVGIAPEVMTTGKRDGHFGLQGMRERALRMRADLTIGLRNSGGTEVTLRVPAAVAYRSSKKQSRQQRSLAASGAR